ANIQFLVGGSRLLFLIFDIVNIQKNQ
ncbi:unnamed protein product, partial [Rotaria magnacalcarata]